MAAQQEDRQRYLLRAAELRKLASASHYPDIQASFLEIACKYERLAEGDHEAIPPPAGG